MDKLIDILGLSNILSIILIINIIIILAYIINIIKLNKLKKEYNDFMKKIGNGNNISELLKKYINSVENIEQKNREINLHCQNLENKMKYSLQKIGIIRYNAFKDTGSDLSFTLALLDDNNNGVVLNGIYSREMSNIYAKPVIKGKSDYTLSEEEKKAIEKAINV